MPSISNSKHQLLLIVETWPLISYAGAVICTTLVQHAVIYFLLGALRSTKDNKMNISFALLLAVAAIT